MTGNTGATTTKFKMKENRSSKQEHDDEFIRTHCAATFLFRLVFQFIIVIIGGGVVVVCIVLLHLVSGIACYTFRTSFCSLSNVCVCVCSVDQFWLFNTTVYKIHSLFFGMLHSQVVKSSYVLLLLLLCVALFASLSISLPLCIEYLTLVCS